MKRTKRGKTKHAKHMKRQTSMLSNKKGCPRRTNVGLDRVSIVPLDWNMDDTQTHAWTCRQACKDARKQRKQTSGTKQAWQATLHRAEVCIQQTGTRGMCLTSGQTQINHKGDGCNHTRTNPWGAESMARPRSREANIDIKYRSKQTYTCI